jgi:hypothetical protein
VQAARLKIERGLCWMGTADPYLLALVDNCRGDRPLGAVLAGVTASAQGKIDAEACLRVVRALVEQGFLLPA